MGVEQEGATAAGLGLRPMKREEKLILMLESTPVTPQRVKHTAGRMWREASDHRTSGRFDDQLDRIRQTAGDEEEAPAAT